MSKPMSVPMPAVNRYKKMEFTSHTVDMHPLSEPGALLAKLRVFLVTGGNKLPVLPEIATRLLELSNKPNVDIGHLVREIERESTVTGRLLAMANSAFYLRGVPASSVKASILRLGLAETRDLVYRIVSASSIFRLPAYAEAVREVRIHSETIAYLTRDICRRAGFDHEVAFLCGLMHDVGKVILLASAALSSTPPPPFDELQDAIEADHAEAGALTAQYWKLPPAVVSAIKNHHATGAGHDPYANALALGDRICKHLGLAGEPEPPDDSLQRLLLHCKLPDSSFVELCDYARHVHEALANEE